MVRRVPRDAPAVAPYSVFGQVVNAVTGAPLARAQVNLNGRYELTDGEGRFRFEGVTFPQAFVMAVKPGYSAEPPGGGRQQMGKVVDASVAQVLPLYQDALVTGRVVDAEEQPVGPVQVRLERMTYAADGTHWQFAGFSMTDAKGEFRIRQRSGRFRLKTSYLREDAATGDPVLPVAFPPAGDASGEDWFDVPPGGERRVEMRVRSGAAHTVLLDPQGFSARGNFQVFVRQGGAPGFNTVALPRPDGKLELKLPRGSYTLRAFSETENGREEASGRVSVGDADPAAIVLRFAPMAQVSVVLQVEAGSQKAQVASTDQPRPELFRLSLRGVGEGEDSPNVRSVVQGDTIVFHVTAGRYRLGGTGAAGQWCVRSATSGPVNLLTGDLVVSPGVQAEPIRLSVANDCGTVSGTVTGGAGAGMVYLVPHQPSFGVMEAGENGAFTMQVPPGAYSVLAVPGMLALDLRDAKVLARLRAAGQDVEVAPGGSATVNLTRDVEPIL